MGGVADGRKERGVNDERVRRSEERGEDEGRGRGGMREERVREGEEEQ